MSFTNLTAQAGSAENFGCKLYIGTVIKNKDPLFLDRIQCDVPELYDSSLGEVPWILPIKYCIFGQGVNYGIYGVPPIGAKAIIELQGNDPNFPIYRGFFMEEIASNRKYSLPGIFGVIDPNGSELTIDTNEQIATYKHISGTTFTITKEGTFQVDVPQNLNINVYNNGNINIDKEANITVNGNCTATIAGDLDCSASQATITASGNITNKCSTFIVEASLAQIKCPVQTGNISNTFGSGGTGATISGGISNTGGDIVSNSVSLERHVHPGVQGGSGTTGTPI